MKKLLSIVIGVLLSTSGVFATNLTIAANLNIDNAGKVTLTDANSWNSTITITTVTGDSMTASSREGFLGIGKHSAKINVSVSESNADYYFTGWTLPPALSSKTGTSWSYEVKHNKSDETHQITANFSPYWTTSVTAIMAGDSESGVVTTVGRVKAKCHNATSISATLADGTLSDDVFSVTQSGSDSEGNSIFTIAYEGSQSLTDIVGKYVNVTLRSNTGKTKTVQVSVIEAATLTFRATDRGTYTVSSLFPSWDGTGSDQPKVIEDPAQLTEVPIILTTDPEDGYIFWGWQIEEEGKVMELLREHSIKKTFTATATITPIFVPNTCGYMVMQDEGESKTEWAGLTDGFFITYWQYKMTPKFMSYDLQEALNVATAGQFVVFENFATIFSKLNITRPDDFEQPANATEAILPKGDGYTIPNGVTLLIPANANYAYGMDKFDTKCCVSNSGLSPYRKLIIESGTQMTVNGTLCVFAYITSTGGVNGSPNACGVIELQDGAHIEVNGKLYSYGYIINPTTTTITSTNINSVGKITANSTAEVYETFQIADWRGGNATSGMLNNEKDVFPMNQYYIQNIEVPITFITGSKESLSTAVDVTGMGTIIAEAYFLLPSSNSDDGFFKLGSNTSITKYYEVQKDRLHFIVNGNSLATTASIENIYLPISNYKVNSTDYVLAVTNNMDISLNNVTMELKYDMCFLPGSTLNINPNAKLSVNGTSDNPASVFVYDFEWSSQDGIGTQGAQKGYFGIENSTIKLLTKRPGGFKTPRRTISKDASIVVNGILEIGQYGELYTTKAGDAEGTDWTSYSYGAEITSTGNGRAKFIRIGELDLTYQAHQQIATAENGNKNNVIDRYLNIPVSSAQLKNADGTYKATTLEDVGKIFVYKEGTWQEPQWILPTFETTLPTKVFDGEEVQLQISTPDKDQHPWVITLDGEGFTTDGELKTDSVTYNASMGDYIKFPIHYAVLNKDGTHSATITVQHSSDTYTTTINATENYKPIFSVAPASPEKLNIGETYVGTPLPVPASSVVNPTKDNVTSLMTDNTYYSRLSWSVVSNSNPEFTFEFGEGMNALSDAKITFTPTSPGPKEATIKLRATYKDANNKDIHSDEVELKVTATAKALEINNFALTENCQNELNNMCVGIPVTLEFQGLTENTESLDFTFNNNGAVGSEVLTLSGEGTDEDPYTIIANSVPAVMPTITISQDPDGTYEGHTTEAYTTKIQNCEPFVQWNWSDLYFGEEFTEPVVSNSDGPVTLNLTKLETKDGTEITDDAEIQKIISYNSTEKKATIGTDLEGEYIATFSFVQAKGTSHSDYSETFTSAIYPRPNVLNVCVESERIFKGLQVGNTDAYFAEEAQVVFPSETSWIINFVGVPDILSFTPTINTQLTVLESANGSSWASAYYAPVNAGTPYEVELEPTTRYLQFSVVQGTALQDLCIKKLDRVKADAEILYMPIAADPENDPTTRTITFTYVSDKDLDIRFSTDDFSSETEKLTKTEVGEYGKVTITVASKATTEQEARLTIQEKVSAGSTPKIKLEVPIETYRFPQKLPIQLETEKDEAKRFYYVATFYKDVEWDAANYAINLKKKTSAEDDNPYVTFAFYGAPKFISFVPLVDDNPSNWEIKESEDGTVWGECQDPTMEDGVLKQTLLYTTRYVCVTYVGKNMDVVKMTKVNILSDQSAVPNPEGLNLTEKNTYTDDWTVGEDLVITTINLTNMTISTDNENFTLSYNEENPATTFTLDANKIANVFGADVVGEIPFKVFWKAAKVSEFGTITITTTIDDEVKTLATVPLVGNATSIQQGAELYTGVKDGYTLTGSFMGIYAIEGNDGTEHRLVDLSNTYDASGKALFDVLVIYGETTTTDGSTIITEPTNTVGSNAKTPVSIYYREDGVYKFAMMEENANAANKMMPYLGVEKDQTMRVYITGFCPYASTGYTKEDEGVWYFQGVNGAKLEIYLDNCYIYSRNKTPEGRSFSGRYDGQAFSENYVRGSGGVLVFENQDNVKDGSFDVTIHTRRNNMFKSNYGCFFELMKGMRAYQVSSPIQVHLAGEEHLANSVTNITFDDKWPTDATNDASCERTNGILSLQKQHNNAPSIDLGNSNTTVEFAGGQVELQNAAVVSLNYKTTLAISYRSGLMAGFPMAYGIGTDAVGGKVRFIDGTTTVIPMEVDVKFRDYYLMDTQILKDKQGNDSIAELSTTSCLRCPTNTVVTGGSHCMMRACEDVTSKGGAPLDENGTPLGIYKYPKTKPDANGAGVAPRGGWTDKNDGTGLVTPNDVPDGYNVESVTPNTNGTDDTNDDYLNFWFTTDEESTVKPEVDKTISFWKACMTEIAAEYMSYGGTVGGDTKIFPNEEIKYLLYCQLDENINNVITAGNGTGDDKVFTYKAPVKDPTGQLSTPYLTVIPTYVGDEWQNYIETVERNTDSDDGGTINTGDDYSVTDKIYYVVPATADVWMTFTAPFNVEKLWIVETYDEEELAATLEKEVTDEEDNTTKLNKRQSVLLEQAKHNADFAAFFGVAMALGRDQTFDEIYRDYIGWAMQQDAHEGSQTDYTKRGKIQLQHYNGSNFSTAHYYLYKNAGEWTMNNDKYDTQWQVVGEVNEGEILMHQGATYSLLFPYCTGCDVEKNDDGTIKKDGNGLPRMSDTRDYWDYWSGKFLIFESTQATADNPHTIKGSDYHEALFAPAESGDGNSALLTGNSTFALMTSNETVDGKICTYSASMGRERFVNSSEESEDGDVIYQSIQPTVSFLIANVPTPAGMTVKAITRTGEIIYGTSGNGTTTGGNMPTVGGGNDLFVTSIAGGINIAVAAPQYVRVLSSTGVLLFSGMVQTSVDVTLPANGVYVVAGENEVQKILY